MNGLSVRSLEPHLDTVERIQSLAILRGCALLGMCVGPFHARSTEPGGIDEVVRTLVWRLVEGKSHGTFALLFGAGFAIQLRRAEARGAPFARMYLRRLGVLALFGVAAHAFFGYNVLLGYAVWGLPLLAIRKWSTSALIVAALFSAVSVALYHQTANWVLALSAGPDAVTVAAAARRALAVSVNDALSAAADQNSYSVLLAARLRHMAWFYTQPFFFMPGATLALFISGLLMVRHGVFERPLAHRRLLAMMAVFGLTCWLVDNWVVPRWSVDLSLGIFRDQWLMFAYVSGALLLMATRPGLVRSLRPIANAGRMALTNYLIQIAALDLLFSGYALGVDTIRPVLGLGSALAFFAVEVAFSTGWLRHFRFGPAEWLWRSLTYGRWQPLGRPALT